MGTSCGALRSHRYVKVAPDAGAFKVALHASPRNACKIRNKQASAGVSNLPRPPFAEAFVLPLWAFGVSQANRQNRGVASMMDRRTFSALLTATIAGTKRAFSQTVKAKTVFYASVGPELTLYDVDIQPAALNRRSSVKLPADVQYASPHPSRRYFYRVLSNRTPGTDRASRNVHVPHAFPIVL